MRKLFRSYIVVGAVVSLTQYVLLDPWFSAISGAVSRARCRSWTGPVRGWSFSALGTAFVTAATSADSR